MILFLFLFGISVLGTKSLRAFVSCLIHLGIVSLAVIINVSVILV